jgi:ubiquinone/menaquinone biosynthesis C-methylase UbiE
LSPAIFEPWAVDLVEFAGVRAGQAVLDLASGTGAVARLAAQHAASGGRVVAIDLSETMLAQAALHAAPAGSAPIERRAASATDVPLADRAVDVVLCQQGLQFFDDRERALAEMYRVLAPGGVVALAVWDSAQRNEPFASYSDAVAQQGIAEPYPGAFDWTSYTMAPQAVEALLSGAGFEEIVVAHAERIVRWPDAATAVAALMGTPYGALLERQPSAVREAVLTRAGELLAADGGPPAVLTRSVLARARRPPGY